jgi:hypothetical protein
VDKDCLSAAVRGYGLKSVAHRSLAGCPARDRQGKGSRFRVEFLLAGTNHDPDLVDAGVAKVVNGASEQGFAPKLLILLRHASTGAIAAAGRDYEGDDPASALHAPHLAEHDLARQRHSG